MEEAPKKKISSSEMVIVITFSALLQPGEWMGQEHTRP